MVRWAIVASVCAVLMACSSPEEVAQGLADGESAADTLDRRTAAGFDPVEFLDEDKRGEAARDFAYSWPAQVSAIAPLAAMLEQARAAELAAQKSDWDASIAEFAGEDCFSCVNRSYAKSWVVAADTPRFLVVGAETYTFTGGAHGNTDYDALVWDRDGSEGKGAALTSLDLFTSVRALETASRGAYCDALLAARGVKLEMSTEGMDPAENCPSVSELVVLPKSTDGEHFDQITFLAAPYVAGSYAEGPYEITVPVTQALLDTVKPAYRSAFATSE